MLHQTGSSQTSGQRLYEYILMTTQPQSQKWHASSQTYRSLSELFVTTELTKQARPSLPTLSVTSQTTQQFKFVSQDLDAFSQTMRQPLFEYITVTSQPQHQQRLRVTSQSYQQLQPTPPRLFVMSNVSCQLQASKPVLCASMELTLLHPPTPPTLYITTETIQQDGFDIGAIFGNETTLESSKKVVIFPPSRVSPVLLDDLGSGIGILGNVNRFLDTSHPADFPNENGKRTAIPDEETSNVNRRCLFDTPKRQADAPSESHEQLQTPLHQQMTPDDTKQSREKTEKTVLLPRKLQKEKLRRVTATPMPLKRYKLQTPQKSGLMPAPTRKPWR